MIRWVLAVLGLTLALAACAPTCRLGEERDGGIGGTGGCVAPENQRH